MTEVLDLSNFLEQIGDKIKAIRWRYVRYFIVNVEQIFRGLRGFVLIYVRVRLLLSHYVNTLKSKRVKVVRFSQSRLCHVCPRAAKAR